MPNGLSAAAPSLEHTTDLGNARRLVRLHGDDLRFVHEFQRWLTWDGRRWASDQTGEVVRRAKATVANMYEEAAGVADDERRRQLVRHAMESESSTRLRAMVELAKTEPGIPVTPDELDTEPYLFAVENGVIDLRTGDLLEHDRRRLLTKLAPVEYDRMSTAPIWFRFLERVVPDPEVRAFLQRAAGYSLTGDTGEQCLFLLWGVGANGKTTYIETKRRTLGDYAIHTPADTLLARRDTGIPNDVARLRGARFVTCVETDENRRLAEAQVKQLTGGDELAARFMRGEWFSFKPVCKLWLATNAKPTVRGTNHAIWRRIRLIPFEVTIPESERDHDLGAKLQAEVPGILAWAVQGCLDWQQHGLQAPQAVTDATATYRAEQDVIGQFLEDACVEHPGARTSAADVYDAYKNYCDKNGEPALSQKALGARLSERGFERARVGKSRHRAWIGIALEADR